MKILYKQVGYPAMVKIIKDDPDAIWSVLDGYIEMIPIGGDLQLVYNSEGKGDLHFINEDGVVICGNVVVTAREYSEFRDLTEEETRTAIEVLEEMEL